MLKLFCIKAVLKASAGIFLYCTFGILSADDATRLRALGDAAIKAQDHKQAAKFYHRYKSASSEDKKGLQDAYIRLIATYISASQITDAKRELAAFSKAFPLADNSSKVLYQSSIYILERKYKAAEELLRLTLKNKMKKGDLYFQLLSTLGLSLRRQNLWSEAAKVYALLEQETKGTPLEFTAFQQKLFCLIMGEDLIKSKKLFAESTKFNRHANYSQLNLLLLLQMIKEKKFSELRKTYAQVMKNIEVKPNPLVYKISQSAIKHFFKNGNPRDAIVFLRDAFKFAPNDHERKDSLLLLINTYVKVKQNDPAIKMALKYIQLYYDDPKTLEVQLQCARLMASEKKTSEALAIYTTLLKEPRLSQKQRITVAREAATIYEFDGSPNKAMRMLSMIHEIATNNGQKMEGKYLQGQLYYKNKEFTEAAAVFEEVMVQESLWQSRGAYWALQSQLQLKDYGKALYIAEELSNDKKNKQLASAGQYYSAYCQEQLGKSIEALKNYQIYAKLYPKDKYAPMAIFAAGKILFTQKDFAKVIELFKDFPAKYPENKFTPNALYKIIFAYYQLQKWDEMEKAIRLLVKNYPDSMYCVAAEFWFVDCLRNRGQYEQAEKWIQVMMKKYSNDPEISARLLYDCALVCFRFRKSHRALKSLEELFKKYPKNNLNANALFLAGNIASKEGNYALAEIYYLRAARLRPKSTFEIACLGRIADCNYSLYNNTFDLKLLKKAAAGYKKLLELKEMTPSVRNQTKYKLGRCNELLNKEDDALDMYNELLYGYQVDQNNGIKRKPVWVVKAAHAAIHMYLEIDTSESAQEAIRVYRLLKEMKLKTGENFDGYIKNIQTKYSLDENPEK
jgi:tetratricopeptide (TPR) repeat protein